MALKAKKKNDVKAKSASSDANGTSKYPRHSVLKVLRIPKAIMEQNAGKECTQKESAAFVGIGYGGPYELEISSALKYGLLERPGPRMIKPTELAQKIIRPKTADESLAGLREAVLMAPTIKEVYLHYRGENLPDRPFFENALTDTFKVPKDKVAEFIDILMESLEAASLVEKKDDKIRVLDISTGSPGLAGVETPDLKKMVKNAGIASGDKCFVVMPFLPPIGGYYNSIYEPAIQKAGLTPIRADNDIFGTGKIIDQIWAGINSARVLVAELTSRNANVFYELGLAHALRKQVVLVSSNEEDVPFDVKHVRVIYYDVNDPFWGTKLIEKVAENILSAISNPNEGILFELPR